MKKTRVALRAYCSSGARGNRGRSEGKAEEEEEEVAEKEVIGITPVLKDDLNWRQKLN